MSELRVPFTALSVRTSILFFFTNLCYVVIRLDWNHKTSLNIFEVFSYLIFFVCSQFLALGTTTRRKGQRWLWQRRRRLKDSGGDDGDDDDGDDDDGDDDDDEDTSWWRRLLWYPGRRQFAKSRRIGTTNTRSRSDSETRREAQSKWIDNFKNINGKNSFIWLFWFDKKNQLQSSSFLQSIKLTSGYRKMAST